MAESAGLDATEILARLYTAHQQRSSVKTRHQDDESDDEEESNEDTTGTSESDEPYWTTGVDLETKDGVLDAVDEEILDLMVSKSWAVRKKNKASLRDKSKALKKHKEKQAKAKGMKH